MSQTEMYGQEIELGAKLKNAAAETGGENYRGSTGEKIPDIKRAGNGGRSLRGRAENAVFYFFSFFADALPYAPLEYPE